MLNVALIDKLIFVIILTLNSELLIDYHPSIFVVFFNKIVLNINQIMRKLIDSASAFSPKPNFSDISLGKVKRDFIAYRKVFRSQKSVENTL